MEMIEKGILRWYCFKEYQIKNEYRNKEITLKLFDYNINFDEWDIKIDNSFLIITKTNVWMFDNKKRIDKVPLNRIRICLIDKNGKKYKYLYSFLKIKKYLQKPLSLMEILKILNIKEKLKTKENEFYICYFIQCDPL